jgi:hypothetical protein
MTVKRHLALLELAAKETESSHEAHFACFDIYIQLSLLTT